MKYFSINKEWHGNKKAGGLFFGIKINYPISIRSFDPHYTYRCIDIKIGLIVVTLNVEIKYDHWPNYE
jgi:hypothetical protein